MRSNDTYEKRQFTQTKTVELGLLVAVESSIVQIVIEHIQIAGQNNACLNGSLSM